MTDLMEYIAASTDDVKDQHADLLRSLSPIVEARRCIERYDFWMDTHPIFDGDALEPSEKLDEAWDRAENLPNYGSLTAIRRMVGDALYGPRATRPEVVSLLKALTAILRPPTRMRRDVYVAATAGELIDVVSPTVPLLAGAIRRVIRTEEQLPPIARLIAAVHDERRSVEDAQKRAAHVMTLWADTAAVLTEAGFPSHQVGETLVVPQRPGSEEDPSIPW